MSQITDLPREIASAIDLNDTEKVKSIISQRIDINLLLYDDDPNNAASLLMYAIAGNKTEIVKILVLGGADVNPEVKG